MGGLATIKNGVATVQKALTVRSLPQWFNYGMTKTIIIKNNFYFSLFGTVVVTVILS